MRSWSNDLRLELVLNNEIEISADDIGATFQLLQR